jgi:HEPN domain-containing protein
LPTPEHLEVARLLLEKAAGDLAALKVLAGDENQADHVVGLLARQTVEKSIKAVLASREVEIPRTHDIGYLTKLCAGHCSLQKTWPRFLIAIKARPVSPLLCSW